VTGGEHRDGRSAPHFLFEWVPFARRAWRYGMPCFRRMAAADADCAAASAGRTISRTLAKTFSSHQLPSPTKCNNESLRGARLARLPPMVRVTCSGLLRLEQQDSLIIAHEGPKGSALPIEIDKLVALDLQRRLGYLNHRLTGRLCAIDPDRCTDHASLPMMAVSMASPVRIKASTDIIPLRGK
jgi:hypothetical protein